MPVKGNQFKTNTFKPKDQPQQPSPKAGKERQPKEKPDKYYDKSVRNSQAIKIIGLLSLLAAAFLFVAFVSYPFTWKDDQSYIKYGGWGGLFKSTQALMENGVKSPHIANWMGNLGALSSNSIIHDEFGISSFLIAFALFVIGYRLLFKTRLFPLGKTLAYSLFFLLYLPVLIGFLHSLVPGTADYEYLEGELGHYTVNWLDIQVGPTGIAFLVAFLGLVILVIAYNIDFRLPRRRERELAADIPGNSAPDEIELEEENISVPVEWAGGRANRIKDEKSATNTEEKPQQQPLQQTPIFHEPVVLTPDNDGEGHEPEFEDEIPLTVGVARPTPILNIEKSDDNKAKGLVEQFGLYDHKLDLASYKYPTLDLLENYGSNKINVNSDELAANKNKIVETLNHYNIEIDKIKATIGPTVTLYEIIPAPGVRISKIKNLEDDIALSLAALGIRIIAPMPGKGTIGIEVPNQSPEMVSMKSVLATEKFQSTTMDLPIALGKTISNEVFIADLAKMPHLLVAGATGQGKSVGINAILVSLLYKKHPAELKFVLVDPKKVELTLFRKIERHFLAKLPDEADAIITDTKKVVNTLNSLCIEMDQRYDLLKDAQVRNLKEYNEKFVNRKISNPEKHRYLPFIVLVVDEFADLMMTAGKEVEMPIARLAQLARAVGIHLVIATQRPSVNIITGTIKANFPSRLAFRVLSKIDSRTILDSGGADQLIGRGDMLLSTGSDLIRLQCAFVDTHEVERISDFIGNQRGYPSALLLPEYLGDGETSGPKDFDPEDRDPMFEEAARLIVLHQQGSTSLIQRKLKLGYNRSGRIIDQLEAAGIVGPFEGSKAREVLYPDEYSLEKHLETLQKPNNH